jgi:hypothetical protein
MSRSEPRPPSEKASVPYREYPFGVRIVEHRTDDPRYRFEAPRHDDREFEDSEMATLYADVYFVTNGFEEAGTGDRGVPPEVIQAGRDTLASYFLTQPGTDVHWVASFYGKKTSKIDRYVRAVRTRAEEIRGRIEEEGLG